MRFASLLADHLNHSSIKVHLSAVCSLYINHGLPDPLVNCLCLQRQLRGIKQVQCPASLRHLPITVDLLQAIQCCLDLSTRDHLMLWTACCLGFFGFFAGWGGLTGRGLLWIPVGLGASGRSCCGLGRRCPELPLLRVILTQRSLRHGAGGSWLGCGLGRLVRRSSALGL